MIGPVDSFDITADLTADLYLLRFDKNGRLISPRTAEMFLAAAREATDVICFSHGWNNIYARALGAYRDFIGGFIAQRRDLGLPLPPNYRPVLLGIIWPSTSFVMPWESGPDIAASGSDESARRQEEMLSFVTDSLDSSDVATLVELVDGQTGLADRDARRAVEIVSAELAREADPDTGSEPPDVESLLEVWRSLDSATAPWTGPVDEDDIGTVGGAATGGTSPRAAGASDLDPRNLLRTATVWKMKARAGVVGAEGVGPLIRAVLAGNSTTRLHLVGHSFGARVVLSAVASAEPPRPARSMLLLQPAVNRWCFASKVAVTGVEGGYRPVTARVEYPILTTFSSFDQPLHTFFHLAVRGSSLGEPRVAALGDAWLYGALGGYGPEGLDGRCVTTPALAAGAGRYDLAGPAEVIAVDGSVPIGHRPAINGHSDVSNPVTYWALHNLLAPTGGDR
ncbi:hypothetical protein [Rhodococcus sp. B50]|uniref:hypothetical protein n=1 Tax=Rhodococcus sp. B50 TaxID=2682847 RepID=UPI001BD6096C|nr:hypothetical protein [Rhodococcus sp. B50]MBS9375359.1 hypothetical protein [Rhodococcus sp. B50]